jgi:hypothetical protein
MFSPSSPARPSPAGKSRMVSKNRIKLIDVNFNRASNPWFRAVEETAGLFVTLVKDGAQSTDF